jgi:hypothetical protein
MEELALSHGLISQYDFQALMIRDSEAAKEYESEYYHSDCLVCHEYHALEILHCWYHEVFLQTSKLSSKLLLPNCTFLETSLYSPPLIVYGETGTGKSKWFESICQFHHEKIIYWKEGTIHKKELEKLPHAWLIMIDDYSFKNKNQHQAVRSILSSEGVYISGKLHHIQIPCVLLTSEFEVFESLRTEIKIAQKCKFVNLKAISIAPRVNSVVRAIYDTMPDAV